MRDGERVFNHSDYKCFGPQVLDFEERAVRDRYLSSTTSDVTLIVQEVALPAHRCILSKRSDYFNAMFSRSFIEANSDKVILKETNLKTFKLVLRYIYTGSMHHFYRYSVSLKELFESFLCARFYLFDSAASAIVRYIKKESVYKNSFLLLSNALVYDVDELTTMATELVKMIDMDSLILDVFKDLSPLAVDYLLNNDLKATVSNIYEALVYWLQCNPSYFSTFGQWFEQLSPMAVEHFLKLRLITPESKIFEVLVRWMRHNPKYSSAFTQLLEHIELHLLDKVQLDTLFEPTQLIDRKFFNNLLCQQQKRAKVVQKVVNQNVINGIDDLRIVRGNVIRFNNSNTRKVTESKGVIIIDLKKSFSLNCLKLKLMSDVCYTVSVSKDMHDWKRVINRSKYQRYGSQVLYFKKRAVRFIRIQSVSEFLQIDADLEALYSTDTFESDPAITPTLSVAS
uniref:BTB domain-containing protein n=1 Tax=Panagrellus redivivus TaxID=6233 RepID=A0A7E4W7Y2_PANRE